MDDSRKLYEDWSKGLGGHSKRKKPKSLDLLKFNLHTLRDSNKIPIEYEMETLYTFLNIEQTRNLLNKYHNFSDNKGTP